MNSTKRSNHGFKIANGQIIHRFRCQLGLTQLELAMNMDCSERLVRKMEKNGTVSLKSLSLLCSFFKTQGIELLPTDLISTPNNNLEVAKQWFGERFIEHKKEADQKWFSKTLTPSSSTISKLEVLEPFAKAGEISVGMALNHEHNVAVNFHVRLSENPGQDPSGSVWLKVENDKITRLHVMLDSELD